MIKAALKDGVSPNQQHDFFINERDILLKLNEEPGYTKLIESGYDDQRDMYYIIMNKLDQDLN